MGGRIFADVTASVTELQKDPMGTAALWESLSQNHPFVDGNNRTTFASTCVFLAVNELDIIATDDEAQDLVLGLYATSRVTFENLRAWLCENTKVI